MHNINSEGLIIKNHETIYQLLYLDCGSSSSVVAAGQLILGPEIEFWLGYGNPTTVITTFLQQFLLLFNTNYILNGLTTTLS